MRLPLPVRKYITGVISLIQTDFKAFLEERANRKPVVADTDFSRDGIVYCGVCGEPKQAWIDWIPDESGHQDKKLVPVMCKCAQEAEQAENQRIKDQKFSEALRYYHQVINGSSISVATHCFGEDDNQNSPIAKTCLRYVDQWQEMRRRNIGILFYGSRGTGKTFYASCIVNGLAVKNIVAVMTTTANLMNVLSKWDKAETMEAISRVPMLALDDLGAERNTTYSAEQMFNVIDARSKANLPTIITTNLDVDEMKNENDIWRSRIYDRVIEMCPIAIRMTGESRRSGIADERKRIARELLSGVTQ